MRPSSSLASGIDAARRAAGDSKRASRSVSSATRSAAGNLVLHGVPRPALAADVLRALRAQGLVSKDFSLASITPSPISLPRTHSLQRSVHLQLGSPKAAAKIAQSLKEQPLFPHFYSSSRPSDVTADSADDFVGRAMDAFEKMLWTKEQRASLQDGAKGRFDRQWVRKSGVSGKRVVLKGLPGRIPAHAVGGIVKSVVGSDAGLLHDGVTLLPESPTHHSAVFALEFGTVAEACRAARRLNMTPHQPVSLATTGTRAIPPLMMRAEVVW